ncbi:hypothetical protein F4694_005680 [Bacillus niacini]|uniref:Uncharacterized protein n=1 Tax=Neobacillus niacini TaxID=86668 RepID=A0A852TPF1_9BACI|nr:hypothetical protein [Neobacillus niacini]NYE08824.1 hypothetical protein [Neobacillus niacini]
MAILKQYSDGTTITRSRGRIDDWCIFVDNRAPYDSDYFNELHQLANDYGVNKVYNDFKSIYDKTTDEINPAIFDDFIPSIASTYGNDSLRVEKLFGTFYTVMLAEENRYFGRTKTKLGKRVKGLAAYQILFENYSIKDACDFSKGRGWQELAGLCDSRGLQR